MATLKGPPGCGGIEIGGARYLPDAEGVLIVADEHVDYARACGYADLPAPDPEPASAPEPDLAEPEPAEPAAAGD